MSTPPGSREDDRGALRAPWIRTGRLLLRRWSSDDRAPFAAMNADPEVMQHFPSGMSRAASDTFVDRIEAGFDEHGFGLWAVEPLPGQRVRGFVGFVGLAVPRFEAAFTPCVEVGWRLRRGAWGLGYASEAAQASLRYGFSSAKLPEIVSFTAVGNHRSRAVMERLRMSHDRHDDFDHPLLPGHQLQHHVLYRMPQSRWATLIAGGPQ